MVENTEHRVPRFTEENSSNGLKTIIAMVLCASGVFLILPFTQYISGGGNDKSDIVTIDVSLPPPPPPPPEPPPPEEEIVDEPPPEMSRNVQQLSLSQMSLALNPGIGDALAGAFAFEGFGVEPDTVGDLKIFDVSDLDQPPRRLKTVLPVYPADKWSCQTSCNKCNTSKTIDRHCAVFRPASQWVRYPQRYDWFCRHCIYCEKSHSNSYIKCLAVALHKTQRA